MSKTYKTHLLTFTAAFAGLFATSQASAALVVYDGFEYDISESASLDGKGSAGNGWVGSWETNGNGATIVEDNMSYSAGSIHINGGNQAVSITGSSNTLFQRQFETISTNPGEDIYFSFLFKEVRGAPSDYLNFALRKETDNHSKNSAGIGNTSTSYRRLGGRIYGDGSDTFGVSFTYLPETTYFLVAKISRDGTKGPDNSTFDKIELWVNPTSTDLGAANYVVDYSTDVDGSEGFSFFGLHTHNVSDTDDYRFDELRIGTDVASVVAVPEPSTYALLFGFVALLSMIIRRRNK